MYVIQMILKPMTKFFAFSKI